MTLPSDGPATPANTQATATTTPTVAATEPATPAATAKKAKAPPKTKTPVAPAGLPPSKPGDPSTIAQVLGLLTEQSLPSTTSNHAGVRADLAQARQLIVGFDTVFNSDPTDTANQRTKAALTENGITEKRVVDFGRMAIATLASVGERDSTEAAFTAAVHTMASNEAGLTLMTGQMTDLLRATLGRKSDKLDMFGARRIGGGNRKTVKKTT